MIFDSNKKYDEAQNSADEGKTSGIVGFCPITPDEIDPSKLFFSVVSCARAKGVLESADLNYTDTQIGLMLNDAIAASRKSYVRRETAKELVEGVFRLLDTLYSPTTEGISAILADIKERKLEQSRKQAQQHGSTLLGLARNRIYHIEHIAQKYPGLCLDFVSDLKAELTYTDIYRIGGETTPRLVGTLGLEMPAKIAEISARTDLLCGLCDLMCRLSPKAVENAAYARGSVASGELRYTLNFIMSVTLGALYAAFYRLDTPMIPLAKIIDIEDDIFELTDDELMAVYCDYIDIFINRHKIDTEEYSKASSELLRLYAFCIHDGSDGISKEFIASALVKFVRKSCRTKTDVKKILLFY